MSDNEELYAPFTFNPFVSTPVAATGYAVPKRTLLCEPIIVHKNAYWSLWTFYMDIFLWLIKISIILYP